MQEMYIIVQDYTMTESLCGKGYGEEKPNR